MICIKTVMNSDLYKLTYQIRKRRFCNEGYESMPLSFYAVERYAKNYLRHILNYLRDNLKYLRDNFSYLRNGKNRLLYLSSVVVTTHNDKHHMCNSNKVY